MKAVERKLNKAQLATIWLLIVSLVLAVAYITLIVVINKLAENNSSTGGLTTDDLLEGEGSYNGQLVAYPAISESQITNIEISGPDSRYGISRYPDDLGSFRFHYYNRKSDNTYDNTPIYYTPPILSKDGAYDYESLYSIEQNDGYNMIYCVTYLCAAISSPYFTERIELPSANTEQGAKERNDLLESYGLTKSESTIIAFMYGERDSETGHIDEDNLGVRSITIGKKALSGTGFYFMVDNRNYVYYTQSEYLSYSLKGLNSFIKGMLVSEGVGLDAAPAPYLVTDFKEWKTSVFKSGAVFLNTGAYSRFDAPTVVVTGTTSSVVDKGLTPNEDVSGQSGYTVNESIKLSFDLDRLKKHPEYERIVSALVGKEIGVSQKILLTLLTDLAEQSQKKITFGENESVDYTYSISKIESVINADGERTDGQVQSTDAALKVTYRYTVGGVTLGHDTHAVIKLSDIPEDAKAKLVGEDIGKELDAPVVFTVTYTKENTETAKEKFVIKSIDAVFDENAEVVSTVTEKCYVNVTYYTVVNGTVGDTQKATFGLSEISDTSKYAPLKTELIGKSKGNIDLVVYEDTFYYEMAREFVTYDISKIDKLVANEIIVSFEFINASDREKDPYQGNALYINTLENEHKLYVLNEGTCEAVIKLLGGIKTDSSTNSSGAEGFYGETVAVGLSLANMEKYNLYDHKIYFELPRGIYDPTSSKEEAEESNLTDYKWLSQIGFTLYISEPTFDDDGKRIRYIGSDMYDIIAKVDADQFDFLDYGFVELWARRDILVMDIESLAGITLDFNMEDLNGTYDFEVLFKKMYAGYQNGEYVFREEEFAGSSLVTHEMIMVKASDDAFVTAFKEKFSTSWGNLASLYNDTMGDGKTTLYPGSRVTLGASYFNSTYKMLMLTSYLNYLSEEEQAIGRTKDKIMTMTVKVAGKDYDYTYDFYRLDDRRVMVSLYRTDPTTGEKVEKLGEVSDFYITTFAFKKLVNNYINLLNGQEVDEKPGYLD